MAVKRRLGAALSGFAETFGKELEAQKTRKQRQQELDFLEQWREAQTRGESAQAQLLERYLGMLEPGGMRDMLETIFGQNRGDVDGIFSGVLSGETRDPPGAQPTPPSGLMGRPLPEGPYRGPMPEGWKLQTPAPSPVRPYEGPVPEGWEGAPVPPVLPSRPVGQPTTPMLPTSTVPMGQPTTPFVSDALFRGQVEQDLPRQVPWSRPSDWQTRAGLELLGNIFIPGVGTPFANLTRALGAARPNIPYQQHERYQLGQTDQVLAGQRQIQEAGINRGMGLGPMVQFQSRSPSGTNLTYDVMQQDIFGDPRFTGKGVQPPSVTDTALPPGQPDQPTQSRLGQQPTQAAPFPGIMQLPNGQFGVVSQPMTAREQEVLLGMSAVFNTIQDLEELALELNQLEGPAAMAQGVVQRIRGALQLHPEEQKYNAMRDAFGPDIRRLSGETGGRFTEPDMEAAKLLIPPVGSSRQHTEDMFGVLRRRIYTMYMSALQGTAFGMSPSSILAPRQGQISLDSLETAPSGGTVYRGR